MKKVLLLIILLTLTISCGNTPESTVSKFIDNVKSKKIKEAKSLTTNGDVVGEIEKFDNKSQKTFNEALLKNMKYTIINSEKQSDDVSIVKVKVENIDVEKVFYVLFQEMIKAEFTDGVGEKNIEKQLEKILTEKPPVLETETFFYVVKDGSNYKIEIKAENIDALFGNYQKAMSNLDNIIPKE